MKKEGWTVWRQGNKEKGRGRWWACWERRGGGQLCCTSLSSLCPDSCEVFGKRKESPSGDPHLLSPPPHKYASVPGPPMGWRSGQRGQRNSLHINILPYSIAKQTMALKEIFLPSLFFCGIKEVGPLIAVKAAPHCLFNMHSQALSHLVGSVLTNK